ncbi:MAG TPA: hypothetical protein VIC58_05505 [Actinomycetota bacterium]
MTVTFADPEPSGFADLVGRLLASNLEREPSRRALLRPSVVRLVATDADSDVVITLSERGIRVANGPPDTPPHLTITAGASDLIDLSAAPLRFGLPDPLEADGRAQLGRLARGHVRVSGMLRHPIRLSRFSRLLSVT